MAYRFVPVVACLLLTAFVSAQSTHSDIRPRAADLGLKVGILPAGPLNAITDVAGVGVGHSTIIQGDNIRTGVTAVLPQPGNLYREKVPAAIYVGNGFGKLTGSTQVEEMGNIESPILLTSTTSVPRVADALTGRVRPEGRLPFELPSSMAAVEKQRPDLPDDSVAPLYPVGFRATVPIAKTHRRASR